MTGNKLPTQPHLAESRSAFRPPHRRKVRDNGVNPFIGALATLPEYIIPCAEGYLTEADIQTVRERMRGWNRCIVELGSGSGGHLLSLAQGNPDALCIGFELRFKRTFRTAEKAKAHGVKNLIVVHTDARDIATLLPAGEIDAVHVNFPDPWDKRRWLKHRLLSPTTLGAIATVLRTGGYFSYKTDHRECFFSVTHDTQQLPELQVTDVVEDLHAHPEVPNPYRSEFEALFLSQHQPVYWLKAVKQNQHR